MATLVIVAMTILFITKPMIITVARNPTPLVQKPGMETFNVVKDKNCGGMSHVMDLVDKMQEKDTPCYPAMTKINVMQEFMHAEENLNAQSKQSNTFSKHFNLEYKINI